MTAADSVLEKRTTAEKDGQEVVPAEEKALVPYVAGQAGGNQKRGKVIVQGADTKQKVEGDVKFLEATGLGAAGNLTVPIVVPRQEP